MNSKFHTKDQQNLHSIVKTIQNYRLDGILPKLKIKKFQDIHYS